MKVIGIIFLIILSLLLILCVLLFLKLKKLPIKEPFNNPKAFLQEKKMDKVGNKKIVLVVGDSITHGLVSTNYVDMLSEIFPPDEYQFINAGLNNQIVWNVLQRMDEIVQCQPDYIILQLGTNDCNDSRNINKAKKMKRFNKLPELPTIELFEKYYYQLVEILQKETNAKIAALSLPILGENPDDWGFQWAFHFQKIIKKIAEEKNLIYLPFHEKMVELLTENPSNPNTSFKYQQMKVIANVTKHIVLNIPFDKISKKNGFQLLIDHLHLNSQGATMLVGLIEEFLNKN